MTFIDNNPNLNRVLMLGLGVTLLGSITLLSIYTINRDTGIIPDKKSKDRLNTLDEVLSYHLGNNWPYILLFILILIIALLSFLHSEANKDTPININDKYANIIVKSIIFFLVLYTISIITVAINSFIKNKDFNQTGDIPNYIPSEDDKTKRKEIVLISFLTLFILFIIIIASRYAWNKFIHKN